MLEGLALSSALALCRDDSIEDNLRTASATYYAEGRASDNQANDQPGIGHRKSTAGRAAPDQAAGGMLPGGGTEAGTSLYNKPADAISASSRKPPPELARVGHEDSQVRRKISGTPSMAGRQCMGSQHTCC